MLRFLLSLLLAFAIPLNAAYAAASSICDGLEGHPQHGEHVGHHVHVHEHAHDDTDNGDPQQSGSDHNHSHAHPLLSWLVPVALDLQLPLTADQAVSLPPRRFVSAIPPRLERPPRLAPVA